MEAYFREANQSQRSMTPVIYSRDHLDRELIMGVELLDDEQRVAYRAKPADDIIEDLGTRPPVESNLDAFKIAAEDAQTIGPHGHFRFTPCRLALDRDGTRRCNADTAAAKGKARGAERSGKPPVGELLDRVAKLDPWAVCIPSSSSPSTVIRRVICV